MNTYRRSGGIAPDHS